jgi:aminoglycoside phosphotransferase (APT) family kinase protein
MSEQQRPRKMHDDEVAVDDVMVRRLVDSQFPQWSDRTLDRVQSTGTDNVIYRLGSEVALRLPRIHRAVSQVDLEWVWLRQLASQLPVPVPTPMAMGEPGCGYPYRWLVYPWLEGADLQHAGGVDLRKVARDIAGFVDALHSVDVGGDPPQGRRAGPLAPFDDEARWAIGQLEDPGDVRRAMAVWEDALRAEPWVERPVWTHGDLLAANIIMRGPILAGVIDWGCAGIGDPACDAQLAWFFPAESRRVFRHALGLDDGAWARARGWVLWQTAMFIPYYRETIPDAVATATMRLRAVLDDADL